MSTKGAADQKKGETITLTQKELDDKIAAVRKGVEESMAKKFADYDELKAKADTAAKDAENEKSEQQKLLDRIAALEAADKEKTEALTKAQIDRLRERVASSRNLTDAQRDRLQGETLEELEADATSLFGEPKPASPESGRNREKLTPGTENSSSDDDVDPDKIAEKVLSKHSF